MPATAMKTDADFDQYTAAVETFTALRKQYLDALGRQPGGAVQVALIKLKGIRDSADEVLFADAEQPGDAGETDWAAEAQAMEAAVTKLRLKIDALAPGASEKSPDDGAKAIAAKVDAFRKTLKTLEAEAEKAAAAVAKAEAAARDVAERGRQLKAEIDQEIAAVEAKFGHDTRAH